MSDHQPITGETSDGYHTFNELYHHRAVLFSVVCNDRHEMAWKSLKHHDGTMYDGMFIVGVETPDGQATYHYDVDPYWDMFKVKELDMAPEWDGHTPAQAIERIGGMRLQDAEPVVRCKECRNSSPIASDITDRPRHCWSGRGVRTGDGFSRVREDGYCDDGRRKEEPQ